MKSKFLSIILPTLFLVLSLSSQAQTDWHITGNAGTTGTNFIGTTEAKDFIIKTNNVERGRVLSSGVWRFGIVGNFAKIDSTGKFTFGGKGVYQVAGNKYVFQYSVNPKYGLFFNSTALQYEFRNSSAASVFSINANTGSVYLNGYRFIDNNNNNTFIGNEAGLGNTGMTNTAVGSKTLAINKGHYNTAIGSNVLSLNNTGNQNTATGNRALYHKTIYMA